MIIYKAMLVQSYSPKETPSCCRDMDMASPGKQRQAFDVLASFTLVAIQFSRSICG